METKQFLRLIAVCVGVVCLMPRPAVSHGRLWEPPGRSTMWRRGYNTPHNYNDNQLFCGGFSHQVSQGYKCAVCGDPYDGPYPNEAGGLYATGTITRTYMEGQTVTFTVDVTANHLGFLQFKICPSNDPKVKVTHECLDKFPIELADGTGDKYYIGTTLGFVNVTVVLPNDLNCDFCVLQWRYHTGNSWGEDPDGRGCVGCGYQEEFYGCSDIKIVPTGTVITSSNTGSSSNQATGGTGSSTGTGTASSSSSSANNVNTASTTNYASAANSASAAGSASAGISGSSNSWAGSVSSGSTPSTQCFGVHGRSDLDQWCGLNCQMGNCPDTLCQCAEDSSEEKPGAGSGCQAIGAFAGDARMDQWCINNCALDHCPANRCACY